MSKMLRRAGWLGLCALVISGLAGCGSTNDASDSMSEAEVNAAKAKGMQSRPSYKGQANK